MKKKLLLAITLLILAGQALFAQITFPYQGLVMYGSVTAPDISSTVTGTFVYTSETPNVVTITASGQFQAVGVGHGIIIVNEYQGTEMVASGGADIDVYQAQLNVNPASYTINWGQSAPTFSFVYSGFVNGDTQASLPAAAIPVLSTTYVAGQQATGAGPDASPYKIVSEPGGPNEQAEAGNYFINYNIGSLYVLPVYPIPTAVTMAATNVTGTSATLNGIINDNGSATTVSFGLATNSDDDPGPNFTPVQITDGPNTLAAGSGNTNFSTTITGLTPGTTYYFIARASNPEYTIYGNKLSFPNAGTLQNQTITFAPPTSVQYGAADFLPVATSTSGLPVSFASSNANVAVNDGAGNIQIIGAGTTTITANQLGNTSYNPAAPVAQTLTVTQAPLVITANNLNKLTGAVNPTLTITYNTFVNGETSADLTQAPTISTTATTGSPAGKYPITVGGAVDANYAISYVQGTLTVAPPSNNALLGSIKTSPVVTLVSTTGTGYLNFKATVANSTTSIAVIPTAQDAFATITVNGSTVASGSASAPVSLSVGANTITTVITAQNGVATRTVIITVTRETSNDALLTSIKTTPTSALKIVTGTSYVNYTTTVPNTISSITVTPTAQDINATITVNGTAVTSGAASAPLALAVGSNTINTVVTAQDGVTTKTYTITVTRALSNDALLTSIKLTPAYGLTVVAGPSYVNYTASVPNSVSSVTVTPTLQDATATIKVNGTTVTSGTASQAVALAVGTNTINTVVTAQDGATTKTYTITVTRAPSADALLTSIKLTPTSSLTVVAGPGYVNYTTTVANSASSITVTAKAHDATATIKVNGTVVGSGAPSQPIPLAIGSNTINIVVMAQDGVTKNTYIITATRAPSSDALLTSLKLTPAETLTIVTGPDYVDYTVSVHNTTSSVTVTPTVQNATATITVNGFTVASGTASSAIALAVGSNTINTIVTAQDGTTKKTYSIVITRAMPGMNSIYEPISVTKPTDGAGIENDGITVHQGVSPNGDGINDYLTIDGITNYPDNNLTIMDRNGVMIYQAKGYDNASKLFDGHSNINGKMQLPGTYFYTLDYAVNGENMHKTGFIILKY